MSNPKKRLRSLADKAWYGKLLKSKCEACGGKAVQVHHFFYKSNYGHLRYDLENGISLCQGCHFVLHHKDPKIIEDKIREKRGEKWYETLKAKALQRPKASFQTVSYYQQVIKQLECGKINN